MFLCKETSIQNPPNQKNKKICYNISSLRYLFLIIWESICEQNVWKIRQIDEMTNKNKHFPHILFFYFLKKKRIAASQQFMCYLLGDEALKEVRVDIDLLNFVLLIFHSMINNVQMIQLKLTVTKKKIGFMLSILTY